jgi:hypothetical protein
MVCSLKMEGSNRKMNHYPALAKNYSIPPCLLVLVSISLRWSLSFSSFLVVLALGVSRGRLAYLEPEVVSLFRFVGGVASGSSAFDAASGLDVPACGVWSKNPWFFSSSETN